MIAQILVGTVVSIAIVVIHVAGLVGLSRSLTAIGRRLGSEISASSAIALVVPSVLFVLLLHVLEVWVWAIAYLLVGEFERLETALYFSTVTATTLGYGDVTLSEQWRLVSGFEAMSGLILFAASTAFLIELARRALGEADRL